MILCLTCKTPMVQMTAVHKFCSTECNSFYRRIRLGTCIIDGCGRNAVTAGSKLCHFHYRRDKAGLSMTNERAIRPKGEGTPDKNGYMIVTTDGKRMPTHRYVVEEVLGKPLPEEAQVHHVNGKKWDNRNTNLVVCPNDAYHKLLHRRAKELGITFE